MSKLVINQAVRSCCGKPNGQCTCYHPTVNEADEMSHSLRAALKSLQTDDAEAKGPALEALTHARSGRYDDAEAAHRRAAEFHDKASEEAEEVDGDIKLSRQHRKAASLHRKAADFHAVASAVDPDAAARLEGTQRSLDGRDIADIGRIDDINGEPEDSHTANALRDEADPHGMREAAPLRLSPLTTNAGPQPVLPFHGSPAGEIVHNGRALTTDEGWPPPTGPAGCVVNYDPPARNVGTYTNPTGKAPSLWGDLGPYSPGLLDTPYTDTYDGGQSLNDPKDLDEERLDAYGSETEDEREAELRKRLGLTGNGLAGLTYNIDPAYEVLDNWPPRTVEENTGLRKPKKGR